MKLKMFQVDAFANHVFEGNPAAVCPLETWLDDSLLQDGFPIDNNPSPKPLIAVSSLPIPQVVLPQNTFTSQTSSSLLFVLCKNSLERWQLQNCVKSSNLLTNNR